MRKERGRTPRPPFQPSIEERVREAAAEVEEKVTTELQERPRLALTVAGAACFALGVAFGSRLVRIALLAAAGVVMYRSSWSKRLAA